MAELVALWMVWNKIAAIACSRGVRARPYQVRAVVLWFAFEFVGGFVAAAIGFEGVLIYVTAFAAALLGLNFSFASARRAGTGSRDAGTASTISENPVPISSQAAYDDAAVLTQYKDVASEICERYTKPATSPVSSQDLTVNVSADSISLRSTGDAATPYKGEVSGLAILNFDGTDETAMFDVIWPHVYRDGRWFDVTVAVRAKNDVGRRPEISELVRTRVRMWGNAAE